MGATYVEVIIPIPRTHGEAGLANSSSIPAHSTRSCRRRAVQRRNEASTVRSVEGMWVVGCNLDCWSVVEVTDEAVGDVLDATESDRRESSIRTRIETAPAAKRGSTTR